MAHGVKPVFEVVGEVGQVVGAAPPGEGFRFGRMFPHLERFRPTPESLASLGVCMTAGAGTDDDGTLPAGYTYFGQFIDHDITRDSTGGPPAAAGTAEESELVQLRSPSLDLDSLYDGQDARAPRDPADPAKMLIGSTVGFAGAAPGDVARGALPNDLPRITTGETLGLALIGDSRNDENLIVAQLHLAFLKFHNKTVDVLAAEGQLAGAALFEAARALVTRHYQWLVLDDFVRHLTDPAVYASILTSPTLKTIGHQHVRLEPRVFKPTAFETPPMPLEFSVAAYRLGHSMIRNGYPWNRFFPGASLAQLFQFTNLSGFIGPKGPPALPSNWIADWRHLFDFTTINVGPEVNPRGIRPAVVKKLDSHLAPTLGALGDGSNLAVRNLDRGRRTGIPSGQAVANHLLSLGILAPTDILSPDLLVNGSGPDSALDDATRAALQEHEFDLQTPLWFYILREAALAGGLHLGPVGSRIMIETFVGLIRCSMTSIFNADHEHPGFLKVFSPQKDSPLRTPGGEPITTMAHLLAFVGDINPLGDLDQAPAAPVAAPAVVAEVPAGE